MALPYDIHGKAHIRPWEPWFAWHPVRIDGKWFWLRRLWRQGWVSTASIPVFYVYMTKREYLIYKLRY